MSLGCRQLQNLCIEQHSQGTHVLCAGECGSGPNVVIMPHGDAEAQLLSHVSTPAKFREALQLFCGVHVPDILLKATEVRVTS